MPKPATARYYESYWAPSSASTPQPALTPQRRELYRRYISDSSVVLDVGCGDGAHYGRMLAAVAQEYHGLELAEAAVLIARQNGIRAQRHDVQEPFPYEDGMFDTILCLEVLEHLFDPAGAVAEMRRVLAPGGQLVVSVPNIAHFGNRVRAVLGGFAPGGTPATSSSRPWADPHIRFFTLRSLRMLLGDHQMTVDELHGEGVAIFTTLPIVSRAAARLVGWAALERASGPFEFLARAWPSLLAGHLICVASKPHAAEARLSGSRQRRI